MHFADGIWGDGLQWNAWDGLMRISWGWEDLRDARHAPSGLPAVPPPWSLNHQYRH